MIKADQVGMGRITYEFIDDPIEIDNQLDNDNPTAIADPIDQDPSLDSSAGSGIEDEPIDNSLGINA